MFSCFDRVLLRGYVPLMSGSAMGEFLQRKQVHRRTLKAFLLERSGRQSYLRRLKTCAYKIGFACRRGLQPACASSTPSRWRLMRSGPPAEFLEKVGHTGMIGATQADEGDTEAIPLVPPLAEMLAGEETGVPSSVATSGALPANSK